jgi:hypothetical protein
MGPDKQPPCFERFQIAPDRHARNAELARNVHDRDEAGASDDFHDPRLTGAGGKTGHAEFCLAHSARIAQTLRRLVVICAVL